MTRKRILSMLVLLAAVATGARAAWTGGTYTATATENLGAITVNGDATLTINSDVTVTVTGGINVASGTLTVTGPGTLVVTGAKGNDGANDDMEGGNGGTGGVAISGNIIVQGGATVTATGGTGGNGGNGGLFGGNGGNGGNAFAGTLTYKSGTVTANGGSGGSGGSGEAVGGPSGIDGKAFANDVDFTQTTGYSVTDGTSTIESVLNQTKVVISGGTPAATTYTVTLKEGTTDAESWTIAPPEATTTGVAQGTEVTATYSGTKKVKSVKAKKKAAAPAAAIAPALVDGATVVIEYNCDGFVTYFTFTNNGGTYSCDITGDESDYFSASLTKQGNTLVFVAQHSDMPDSFDSTINFDTTSDTYSFAKKTEELFYFKISVNGTDITDKLSEVQ